jgi:hypothetical protein
MGRRGGKRVAEMYGALKLERGQISIIAAVIKHT